MIVALYILLALLAVGAVLRFTDRPVPLDEPVAESEARPADCCGLHAVCERTDAVAMDEAVEYFDDEELDEYAGRPADGYTADEIDQFREVLLTLPAGEAAPWAKSLERRGVSLPDELRDEFLLIVAEG